MLQNFHLIILPIKGKVTKELQLKHLSTRIQDVTSNVANAEKNWKEYVRLQFSIPGTQGAFLDKVILDIDGFTDEAVVYQCNAQVVKNTFVNR